MCELFTFAGEQPALLQFALHEFAQHGGGTRNADGWGIAHYIDRDVRLLKEPSAARDSACLSFIEQHPLRSALVLSHIRRATQGVSAVRNCQPFVRELGGAMHVFAHNGNLDRLALGRKASSDGFRPVGETDSELAFCILLERLRPLWRTATGPPDLHQRRRVVAQFAQELRELGPANFIYADDDALFAHGHKRTQEDGTLRPPGLHLLCRDCSVGPLDFDARGLQLAASQAGAAQVLLASVALTSDPSWRALREGELLVVRAGRVATGEEAAAAVTP